LNTKQPSLKEIIDKLNSNEYPELTYVGKDYTKLDLINDLLVLRGMLMDVEGVGEP